MSRTLNSYCKMTLLTFSQTGLLTSFDLPVYVYVSLQCLEVLVVKEGYIGSILKYLCHLGFLIDSYCLERNVIEVNWLITNVFDLDIIRFLS